MRIIDIYKLRKKDGLVGIEIEMEGKGLPINDIDPWVPHNDGSLRAGGREYVLAEPIKEIEVRGALEILKANFERCGSVLSPSNRCGVHVHLNVQNNTFDEVLTFIALFLSLERLMVKYCGEQREGNLFCLRSSDAEDLIVTLQECVRQQSFNKLQRDVYRYSALNCSSLSKYGSLEFRSLQTPKDIMEIVTWVNLLLKIKSAAKDFVTPMAIVEGMSMKGADKFINNVFQELASIFYSPDLELLLLQGIRLVQDFAYVEPQVNQLPDEKALDELEEIEVYMDLMQRQLQQPVRPAGPGLVKRPGAAIKVKKGVKRKPKRPAPDLPNRGR